MKILFLTLFLSVVACGQTVTTPMILDVIPTGGGITFGIEDSVSTKGTAATITQAFTVTNADLLVVLTTMTFTTPSSVTYNGTGMTELITHEYGGFTSSIFTMANPPTGAHNVVVTPNYGANEVCVTILGFKKTHDTTPTSNEDFGQGNNTAPTVTVSSATGAIVVSMLCWNIDGASSVTPAGGQIQILQQTEGSYNGASACRKAGAASTTLSWTIGTAREWSTVGVSINPE